MRILQLNNYAYLKGGSEKVFIDTTNVLREHGHDVRCFSMKDSMVAIDGCTLVDHVDWSERHGLISKIKGVSSFIYNKRVAIELEKLIKDFKPDIAHIHIYYGRLSNSVVSVLNKYKIPIVQSVHEYRLICPAYTCMDRDGKVCERCATSRFKSPSIIKKCLKNNSLLSFVAASECCIRDTFFNNQRYFSKFIMVSEFIKNLHVKYYPEMEKKSIVLHNMIDIDKYAQYRVDINQKSNYYLYIGRLSYEKGLWTLLEAFKDNPKVQLKIAGTGPLESDIKTCIDKHNLTNIELLGFLSGQKLYDVIARAKFLVIPSEWYENNPISVIESLALGTPVIGSNIGGIPELVINDSTGFLYNVGEVAELKNIILKTIDINPFAYRQLVNNGIKLVEDKCSKNNYYKRLIDIYQYSISALKR